MKERLKALRKYKNLSQEEFGKRIGVGKSAISYLESGRSNLTDQTIILICKEFRVNEHWLRTGEGEMFIQIPEEDETAALVSELLEDNGDNALYGLIKDIMAAYSKLSPSSKKAVEELCENVYKSKKKGED